MKAYIDPPAGPDIIEVGMSPKYLGKDYLSTYQRSILKAIYGLPMERDERLAFLEISEGREPRKQGYDEAAIVSGVRSGKTEIGALVLTYECWRWLSVLGQMLPPGKTAKGIIIAQNERGANEAREYVEGSLQLLEEKFGNVLAASMGQEKAITGKSIKLAGPCEIVIYPSRKASVRGATGLCFIGDEVAFWEAAEGAYNQDSKIIRAVRSRFATLSRLHPKRLLISSPDEEEGVLYEAWKMRDERRKVLVVNAPSWTLNPSLSQEFLDDEQEQDPESFVTEYGAEFRKPGGAHSFLPAAAITACVEKGRFQNEPKPGIEYLAWMDAAFKQDRFSFGIGHAERTGDVVRVVVDRMRHWTPPPVSKRQKQSRPLDDRRIVREIVKEMRPYGIDRIHGDQFADVPLKNMFLREHGITFIDSPVSNPEKVDAFKNLRAALKARLVDLPDDPILVKDLKCLVRKQTAGGHMSIAAPRRKGAYDDAANVCARIVNKLLPLAAAIDIAEWNAQAGADKENRPHMDWRDPDRPDPVADLGDAFAPIMDAVM